MSDGLSDANRALEEAEKIEEYEDSDPDFSYRTQNVANRLAWKLEQYVTQRYMCLAQLAIPGEVDILLPRVSKDDLREQKQKLLALLNDSLIALANGGL